MYHKEEMIDKEKHVLLPLNRRQLTYILKSLNYIGRSETEHLERITGLNNYEIRSYIGKALEQTDD